MTMTSETMMKVVHKAGTQTHFQQVLLNRALQAGRFILHLLEMGLAMMAGMVILHALDILTPDSASYSAAFEPGTILFDFVMAIFMTVPMVVWMLVRDHGRRHVAEMAFGMNAPVAVIIVLRLLGAEVSLPWLADVSHPAMLLGMIVAMLARGDHYTGKADHSAH